MRRRAMSERSHVPSLPDLAPAPAPPKTRLTVYLEPYAAAWVRSRARRQRRTLSDVVAGLIEADVLRGEGGAP